MVRETGVQSQVESYQKIEKMVLHATLLSTQHYKVWMKGKMEQSWEWSNALPFTLCVVAIVKGAFRSPSTKVTNNFTLYQKYFHFQLFSFIIFLLSIIPMEPLFWKLVGSSLHQCILSSYKKMFILIECWNTFKQRPILGVEDLKYWASEDPMGNVQRFK